MRWWTTKSRWFFQNYKDYRNYWNLSAFDQDKQTYFFHIHLKSQYSQLHLYKSESKSMTGIGYLWDFWKNLCLCYYFPLFFHFVWGGGGGIGVVVEGQRGGKGCMLAHPEISSENQLSVWTYSFSRRHEWEAICKITEYVGFRAWAAAI